MLRKIKNGVRRVLEARQRARLFGDLAPMVPPVWMMFDGPRNLEEFKENGEEFLKIYREVGGLRPNDRMLDVGFGIGRKTIPLTRYLDEQSVYEGLEITKAGVEWCSQHITPRRPNFRFRQIDVYNECTIRKVDIGHRNTVSLSLMTASILSCSGRYSRTCCRRMWPITSRRFIASWLGGAAA
jgi:hypothetical protein